VGCEFGGIMSRLALLQPRIFLGFLATEGHTYVPRVFDLNWPKPILDFYIATEYVGKPKTPNDFLETRLHLLDYKKMSTYKVYLI
jgi:hypothetical protein